MDGFAIFLVVVVLAFVGWNLVRMRKRQAKRMEEAAKTANASGLSTMRDLFEEETGHRAPLSSFHVVSGEARVTFDVPLPDPVDPILNDLLLDEAAEVVRERSHDLPIDDVIEIVVYGMRGGEPVEAARKQLPAPGELPPQESRLGLSMSHVARDPFTAPFDESIDHAILYETRSNVPADELGPIIDELKIPQGLDRGMRALGVDPAEVDGAELILALLRMFGYSVAEHAYPGAYMAIKNGVSTYVLAEGHQKGEDPEVSEAVIRRFLADFGSSGADRGMLISGKYAPFLIHEIESRQPRVRFITRERVQRFVDNMALG